MDPDAIVDNDPVLWEDFVPFLKSLDIGEQLLEHVFFPLCGPDLLRCRTVSRLWRNTIGDLTRPHSPGHAFLRRSVAWSTCDDSKAKVTKFCTHDSHTLSSDCDFFNKMSRVVCGTNVLIVMFLDYQSFDLDLQIFDRRNPNRIFLKQTLKTTTPVFTERNTDASDSDDSQDYSDSDDVDVYATFHNNMLVICWKCSGSRREPAVGIWRFVNVCLDKYAIVKDVVHHRVRDEFTHPWIERQAVELGREDVRQEILEGMLKKKKSHFRYRVDATGYVIVAKVKQNHTYDVKVYNPDLQVIISRRLQLLWPITDIQYAHPIVVLTLESSGKMSKFWALWNVELPGSPAALWCGPLLSAQYITSYPKCRLKSSTHLFLACEWFARHPGAHTFYSDAYAREHALVPPARAINVASGGETAHPPTEPDRSHMREADLTSSTWRLQAQRGDNSIPLPFVRSNVYAASTFDEAISVHKPLVEGLEDKAWQQTIGDCTTTCSGAHDVHAWSMAEHRSGQVVDFWNLED